MFSFLFLIISLISISLSYAQDSLINELNYKVDRVQAPSAISKIQLDKAQTLEDLNRFYRPAWVKEYLSVEISTIHNGVSKKALSTNDTLTIAQKNNISKADFGSKIDVKVRYIPKNKLYYSLEAY